MDRFNHQEGMHGAMVIRFGLLRGKGWYRRMNQAHLDVAMTFCIIHALSLHARQAQVQQAPPLQFAA
jgi:hypothetical protein